MGDLRRSSLQGGRWRRDGFMRRRDAWRGLRWELEPELVEEDFVIGVGLGTTGEDQGSAVCCGEVHVEHLDVGELVEDGAGCEAPGDLAQLRAERDVEAVGHEGCEDVSFDAVLELMEDGPQLEIVLEVLEGGLDLDELDVELPQPGRLVAAQIAAQEISAVAPSDLAQLAAVQRIAE